MNNRTLLIIFGICLLLFLGGKVIRGNKTSSFDADFVTIDSVKVDHIRFVSAGENAETFELKRNGQTWEAVRQEDHVKATLSAVESILSQLSRLEAKRVVTKDAAKYPEYEIEGTQASKVTVWEGKKQVADLEIGGFRFDQATRSASSFIKRTKSPEVYEVDGFLSMGLKARFDQFRDKKLIKVAEDDLTSVAWEDPSRHKQTIQKDNGTWYYAGMEAVDSTAFKSYLSALVNAQGSEFSELKSTAGLPLLEQVTLSGNNMEAPTVISAYTSSDTLKPFLIYSTANSEAVFKSDSNGLYKRIFLDLRPFWPNGK